MRRLTMALFGSYMGLSLISLLSVGHLWLQRILVMGWFLLVARVCARARRAGIHLLRLSAAALVSQLPGVVLVISSIWARMSGRHVEVPAGLMEIWYHPFVCLLDRLPPRSIDGLSAVYLSMCLVPLGILALCALSWTRAKS